MNARTWNRRASWVGALALALLLPCSVGHAGGQVDSLKQGGKLKKDGTLSEAYCTYVVTNVMGKCGPFTPGTIVYVPRSSPEAPCATILTAVKGLDNVRSACGLNLQLLPQTEPDVGGTGRTLGGAWITF